MFNKPPFPHRNHSLCLAFLLKTTFVQAKKLNAKAGRECLPFLFFFLFASQESEKITMGQRRGLKALVQGMMSPEPLSNLAVISGIRYQCMSNFGVRIKEKGPNVKVTSKRASAGNPDRFRIGGPSPTPEPQATWTIELSPGMVHPGHPRRWHTHSLL